MRIAQAVNAGEMKRNRSQRYDVDSTYRIVAPPYTFLLACSAFVSSARGEIHEPSDLDRNSIVLVLWHEISS